MSKTWTIGADTARAKKKAETHKRILLAASELFESKGFYQTKASDIAKRAGVSPGSIYAHFGAPERIMAELHEELVASRSRYLTKMRQEWPDAQSAWQLLLSMLSDVWGVNKSTLQMRNVAAYHSWAWICPAEDYVPLSEVYSSVLEELQKAATMAQQQGEIGEDVDVAASVQLMGIIFFQGIQAARISPQAYLEQYEIFIDRVHLIFRVNREM